MPTNFAEAKPELVTEWHSDNLLQPTEVLAFSQKQIKWICSKDVRHVWTAPVARRSSGAGCPVCANRLIIPGINDLASQIDLQHLLDEWHPANTILPTQVAPSSNKMVDWVCSTNHEHMWRATIANRSHKNSGCPHCRKQRKHSPHEVVSHALRAEWHPLNDKSPDQVGATSSYKARWICANNPNHEWEALVGNRNRGSGCPYCSGRNTDLELQNLAIMNPELATEYHAGNLIPVEELSATSSVKVKWNCAQDASHVWDASVYSRHVTKTGCPLCLNRTTRESLEEHPDLVASWSDKNTREVASLSAGSAYRALWTCLRNPIHPDWEAGVNDRVRGRGCPACAAQNFSSAPEQEIVDILDALNIEYIRNHRSFANLGELDIFIPSHMFAIEFNGIYWHSEKFKDKHYHRQKHLSAKTHGITLYQIWEDDWKRKRDIVVRGILHRLGLTHQVTKVLHHVKDIYAEKVAARQTKVISLDFPQASEFLNENHIQGSSVGTLYAGLTDSRNRLRAVMVMTRKPLNAQGQGWQIERYATAGSVVGGFTKLLAWAEKNINELDYWLTFADHVVSDGVLYENHGFVVDGLIPPDYKYVVTGKRVHKFNYRLKRFKNDPSLVWQDGLSESELARLNNLQRIWDSGKTRYIRYVSQKANVHG